MGTAHRNIYVLTRNGVPVAAATSKKRAYEKLTEIFKQDYKITKFDNDQLNK
jgi:hypothetical protein